MGIARRWGTFIFLVLHSISVLATTAKKFDGLNCTMTEFVETLLHRPGYDRSARPGLDTDETTYVLIDMFINGLSSINEIDMEYRVDLYLRQTWNDYRLSYKEINKSLTLNYNQVSSIWVPDLFFRNEKSGKLHEITVPNRLLRIWPNGTILYSQRVTMQLDCQMFLEKYPMDNQTCTMIIGSYGYTTNEVDFIWHIFKNPLRIKENLMLPEFEITGTIAEACNAAYYTGSFACLVAEVYLKRQFEFYLLQTYVPSLLVVVLSWVSFWIDIDAVPARITLGLLTVLTMTTQAASISERLPRVSYVKAIDVWMATCLVFVFSALIEYSAVNVLYRRRKNRQKRRERELAGMGQMQNMQKVVCSPDGLNTSIVTSSSENQTTQCCPCRCVCVSHRRVVTESCDDSDDNEASIDREAALRKRAIGNYQQYGYQGYPQKRTLQFRLRKLKDNEALLVDVVSRILFPFVFLVFNILYWVFYIIIL